MKFLITGGNGQLAQAFSNTLRKKNFNFSLFTRSEFDITNAFSLRKKLEKEKPQVLINCAAYNHVDFAEENSPEAYLVNTYAVQNLADLCASLEIKLIHFSSDYVFDGKAKRPYTEVCSPNPINVYGKSKYLAENAIMKTGGNYLIFRTSWVYGVGAQNFVYKFLKWASASEVVSVAYDEISVPTSSLTIADVSLKAIIGGLEGLYHLTCSGYCSRYDFALEIVRVLGMNTKVLPVRKKTFHLKAARGDFLVLDNSKLRNFFQIPFWKDDLLTYLKIRQ